MKTRGITGLLLMAVLAPLWAADSFNWTDVGERAFAVEVPSAGVVSGKAVHEWRVLITLGPATPLPPEPTFTFIPPESNGADIELPHSASYGDADVVFQENTSTDYELLVTYPPTGAEDIDRIGYPDDIDRWVVVVKHPNVAGGGTYGSVTVAVAHREVDSMPTSTWSTGKVFLNDPPAPAISPSANPLVYNLNGDITASVNLEGDKGEAADQLWYASRTYEYDWSPADLGDAANPDAVDWGAGVYNVSLIVKELLKDRATEPDIYQSGSGQIAVVVKQPPTAAFLVNPQDEIISFDAAFNGTTSSANAPAGARTDLNYHWDYNGDGTEDETTTDPIPAAAYHFSTPGVYQPTLQVIDAYDLPAALVSRDLIARDRLGLPQAGWVPGSTPRPVIDGVLEGDTGWAGAYRRTYDMGAGNPPVAFRASKEQAESSSQPYLFMAFEVQDSTFDEDDAVVLAFNPQRSGGIPALARRLVFYPFASGPAGGTVSPEVWKDSSAWSTDPGWSIDNLQAVSKANGTSWVLEMRIPTRAGAWGGTHWIDLANQFLFYFSVVQVAGGTATAAIYNWPKESEEISGNIDTYAYPSAQWGVVDKADGALSNGVYLERAHFGTRNDPISTILLSSPNTFFAEPENLTGRGGTSVTANDVTMSVRLANWGLPPADFSLWERIITDADPTDIPAGATGVLEALWEVPDDKEEQYRQHPHQCIHVELDSAGDAVFAIRSIARNMDFVEGSSFRRKAEISGRGYGEPPAGERQHRFLIKISRQVRPVDPVGRKSAGGKPGRGSSELTWTADGFRETGRTIVIHDHRYQVVDAIGSFGYVVHHEGPVARWKDCLGGSLKKLDKDLYAVKVAPETARLLRTVAWPLEYAWSTAAGAGLVKMLGSRAADYDQGYAGFAGGGYPLLPWLELMLRCSYLYFPVSSTGTGDTSMFWFTGAARLRLEFGRRLALFAGAGPGIGLEGGATLLGFEGNGGLELKVLPVFAAELGAEYRATFDLATQMAGVYVAVVWRF